MKKLIYAAFIAFAFLVMPACKEIGPQIELHGPSSVSDTTWVETPVAEAQLKNVVIEEFTGVKCVNCPQGHALVESIISANAPGRIVPVALHPYNSLDYAYPFSATDLEDSNSTYLMSYLVWPNELPVAAVDRQLFPGAAGSTGIEMDRDYWQASAATEIGLATPVNIVDSAAYNSTSRELTIFVTMHFTQTITDPTHITIALTEDSIITAQLDGAVIDTSYVHMHVLRNIITGVTGDNVIYSTAAGISLQAGRVIRLVYKTTLNSAWVAKNMHIVVFVHDVASTSQQIYQGSIMNMPN